MNPTITFRRGGRALAAQLVPHLDRWAGAAPYVLQLHSGDVGWQLRHDDEPLEACFWSWAVDGSPVACGLTDAGVLRTAVDPAWWFSPPLARRIAVDLRVAGLTWFDGPAGSAVRARLVAEGWAADDEPWVLLHRDLTGDAVTLAREAHADVRAVGSPADVEARVAVQRSAFEGSTFTASRHATMAAGPSYDARFEHVAWTPLGEPAAAATGWYAGRGRPAILEPVGTHRRHVRQGYGRRVVLSVAAALAAAGASGVQVHTPVANEAAVRAYLACGLRRVEVTAALFAPDGAG